MVKQRELRFVHNVYVLAKLKEFNLKKNCVLASLFFKRKSSTYTKYASGISFLNAQPKAQFFSKLGYRILEKKYIKNKSRRGFYSFSIHEYMYQSLMPKISFTNPRKNFGTFFTTIVITTHIPFLHKYKFGKELRQFLSKQTRQQEVY